MLHIAICDDEKYMSDKIKRMASDFFGRYIMGSVQMLMASGVFVCHADWRTVLLYVALLLAAICYRLVYKYFINFEASRKQYVLMIITPILMLFLTDEYINSTLYGNVNSMDGNEIMISANHYQMFVIQLLGMASLFCILFAYQKLLQNFRHDIRNHITVVRELLQACKKMDSDAEKYIRVTGRVQGEFILLEIENSFQGSGALKKGTGLSNINAVAEKYHGTMSIKTQGTSFVLSILLIIPQHPADSSRQIREIKELKEKKKELEQQIKSASGDEEKVKELESKLAQVERELSQKDNDTYRRQHSTFSQV